VPIEPAFGALLIRSWLSNAIIPASVRRVMTIGYIAAVENDEAASEAVRRRIVCRNDERLQIVRPATDAKLKGLRIGAVRNRL
jgi:hypothetical protein